MPPTAAVVAGAEPEMAAEEGRRDHGDHAEAAGNVGDQGLADPDQAARQAAPHHQVARQHETGDGQQREQLGAVDGALGQHDQVDAGEQKGGDGGEPEAGHDRHAADQKGGEAAEQGDRGGAHRFSSVAAPPPSSASAATACTTIRAPQIGAARCRASIG